MKIQSIYLERPNIESQISAKIEIFKGPGGANTRKKRLRVLIYPGMNSWTQFYYFYINYTLIYSKKNTEIARPPILRWPPSAILDPDLTYQDLEIYQS